MTEPLATDLYETFRADALRCRQLSRVVEAAGIGSVIEWYDFLIYGTATRRSAARLPGREVATTACTRPTAPTFGKGRPRGARRLGELVVRAQDASRRRSTPISDDPESAELLDSPLRAEALAHGDAEVLDEPEPAVQPQ